MYDRKCNDDIDRFTNKQNDESLQDEGRYGKDNGSKGPKIWQLLLTFNSVFQ